MKKIITDLLAALLLAAVLLCGCAGSNGASHDPAALLSSVTLELCTGTRWGSFDETLGQLGGVPLLDEEGQVCGGIALLKQTTAVLDTAGTFCKVNSWQERLSLLNFAPLPAPDAVPALTASGTDERGALQHYAFYLPDPEGQVYALWLDAETFDVNSFENFALSANFAAD